MFRRLRPAAIGLIALVTATHCTASPGTAGTGPPGTSGPATTAAPIDPTAPSTTGASSTTATPIGTTTPNPDAVSSTTSHTPTEPAYCPNSSDIRCETVTAAGSSYLEAGVTGGTYGLRILHIGGDVVASLNPDHAFYPASSLKVLQHLHAIRWVAAQSDPAAALATPIPIYEDTCTGQGTSWTEPLAVVLEAMMVDSDNQRANAVQDHFGRAAINVTAVDVVGTSGTLLAHRFGCGGPQNDPANRSTARDLSRIYEQVALRETLDGEAVDMFTSLMLGPAWPSLESAVSAEGETLGLEPATVEAFRAGIELAYKAGWWGTDLSVGGLLRLPSAVCEGNPPRAYTFAAFVDGADAVADGFDLKDLVTVVLREEIRAALLDFSGCPG
ncbi:MAG: serine hydrolase [Actinomycetota bacterium]